MVLFGNFKEDSYSVMQKISVLVHSLSKDCSITTVLIRYLNYIFCNFLKKLADPRWQMLPRYVASYGTIYNQQKHTGNKLSKAF